MKKTSKVLGAIGLSAALAIGCALPAFAEGEPAGSLSEINGNTYSNTSLPSGTGTDGTTVGVKSYISNISVQVPLEAIVYADVVGSTTAGEGLKCPSSDVYKLTNKSTSLDLKVSKIDWDFCKNASDTYITGWKIVNDSSLAKAGTPDSKLPNESGDNFGNLYITLEGNSGTKMQLKENKKAEAVNVGETLNWVLPKQSVDNAGTITDNPYSITMKGSNSQLLNQVKDGMHMEVFKIKYTFAPSVDAVEGVVDSPHPVPTTPAGA
ncbi:hypothetical protein [Adlercreutzia sp. ZJ304]|uniref:hypothetical protein n=1 Tax=Adlercreutzia sp. ZJ304 TaxID=2709791 RepID=UPI0013EAFC0E|nr:hypothetical protein [Adlercreutzia sp. ZJ304]